MKNIKIELPILITMIFSLIVTGLFFLQPNVDQVIFSQESQNGNLGEILQGTEIVQEIPVNKRNISSISVLFGTYMRVNSSDIDYSLYSDRECKKLLYESKVKAASIEDNKYKALKIDYDTSNYDKLYLKITTSNSSLGNAVTIWNNKAQLPNVLWKNNENNGSACIKVNEIRKLYIPNYLKIILVVLILSGSLILCLLCLQKKEIYYDYIMYFYMAFVIFFCLYWSIVTQFNYAPDEWFRLLLPNFIFKHNELPIATNTEVSIGITAKISYAYYATWLPAIISATIMKITSAFTVEKQALLHAARFASVVASGGTAYFAFKIARELFHDEENKWIFILLSSFLPQFIFLGSYVNNDCFAVFASAIIFYSWLKLEKEDWISFKYATLLSVGMILALLSYYNGYMWVLTSCCLFCYSLYKSCVREGNVRKKINVGIYIFVLTTLFALPFFIRNFYLYNELFGLKSFGQAAIAINREANIPPAHKFTEKTIFDFNFWKSWLKTSIESFFAVFGWMTYGFKHYAIYRFFYLIFATGILASFSKKSRKVLNHNLPLNVSLFVCGITPIFLSAYFTWNVSYQPQGRYFYPGLLSICYFVTMGLSCISRVEVRKIIYTFIAIALILITSVCGTDLILNTVKI